MDYLLQEPYGMCFQWSNPCVHRRSNRTYISVRFCCYLLLYKQSFCFQWQSLNPLNTNLCFLSSLNLNQFTGTIPASIGRLSKLYWFDIADNQIEGGLPVSSASSPGLDMLVQTGHLYIIILFIPFYIIIIYNILIILTLPYFLL